MTVKHKKGPAPPMSLRATLLPLAALALAWYYFSGQIQRKLASEELQAISNFRDECHDHSVMAQQRISGAFQALYEHLRTIARLPGLRRLPHAAQPNGIGHDYGLGQDTVATIQEIYNNLSVSLDVSEFYVLPRDYDPEAINPQTQESWRPIAAFSQLTASGNAVLKSVGENTVPPSPNFENGESERQQMRSQLDWFREHHENENTIDALSYPALCSPEVIIHDNRRYLPSAPDDKDRSGLVYSVPFYDESGRIAGSISAVVLTHVIRGLLPSTDFVLVNLASNFAAVPYARGTWSSSEAAWRAGHADDNLLYSEAIPVAIHDANGQWRLWAGAANDRYANRSDIRAAKQSAMAGYISLAIALFTFGMIWFFLHRARILAKARGDSLEMLVQERTAELLGMSRRAGMAEVASGLLHNIGNVMTSANVSVRMLSERVQASRVAGLSKAATLFREQGSNLGKFLTEDSRGKQLPVYLETLATQLIEERKQLAEELKKLGQGVEHMIEILDSQRQIANSPAMIEVIGLSRLAHSAITLVESSLKRHGVTIVEHLDEDTEVYVDHSRALQILVNLLTNAKDACLAPGVTTKKIEVRTRVDSQGPRIEIADSGMGIAPENLTRMFSGRFSTKQKGRGIGLHFSAIAATDMGGNLKAFSEGPGRGAMFSLTLSKERNTAETTEKTESWLAAS